MAKRTSKTEAKFKRIAELNSMIDARTDESRDARKAKAKLADKWVQRRMRSVEGFFKRSNTTPGVCFEVVA